MNKRISTFLAFLFCYVGLNAQELNAKLNLNTSKISGSDKAVFTTLQNSLEQFINGTKWTESSFSSVEKIDCTFNIILNSMNGNSFSGEIQVTSNRPVYNSSYITPLFNYRDVDFTFNYTEGEMLEFTPNNISSNLIAVISFYTYIVIGLDYDSFAPGGGTPYFETAMQIVNAAQSLGAKGWTAFENDRNRYALALGLTQESMKPFHQLWYRYHRLGLDDMASNVDRGKGQISLALEEILPKLKGVKTSDANLLFFSNTKLDEIVQIFGKSDTETKQALYKSLNTIFPTKSSILDKLRK
jgi:hypothetical protein